MTDLSIERKLRKKLYHFWGTDYYYKLSPFSCISGTDGIMFLIEELKAYWLVSDSVIFIERKLDEEAFIIINLYKEDNKNSCIVEYTNRNEEIFYSKKYDFTDFPLSSSFENEKIQPAIILYYTNGVLMLNTEY